MDAHALTADPEVRRPSVFYTSAQGAISGFQVVAASGELTADERKAIELNSAVDARLVPADRPVVRLYRAGARWAATAIVGAGTDYTGREGNILAHTIVLEPGDVDARGPSLQALLDDGALGAALPTGPAEPVTLALRRVEPDVRGARELVGALLPEVLAWLAAGGALVFVVAPGRQPGPGTFEALRALLPQDVAARVTFSTSNDSPRFRRYTLDVLAGEGAPDSLAAAFEERRDLAAFDLGRQTWAPQPRIAPAALAYSAAVLGVATSSRLEVQARARAVLDLQRLVLLFQAGRATLDADAVEDAATFLRLEVGLLVDARPWRKRLISLLGHARSLTVVEVLRRILPGVVAESVFHADVPTIVNLVRVLDRTLPGDDLVTTGLRTGLTRRPGLTAPLLPELEALSRDNWPAAARALLAEPYGDALELTTDHLRSLLRCGPAAPPPHDVLAGELLKRFVSHAEVSPNEALLAVAVKEEADALRQFVPRFGDPVFKAHELAVQRGVDVAPELERLLRRSIEVGDLGRVVTYTGMFVDGGVADQLLRTLIELDATQALLHPKRAAQLVPRVSDRARAEALLYLLLTPASTAPLEGHPRLGPLPRVALWVRAHTPATLAWTVGALPDVMRDPAVGAWRRPLRSSELVLLLACVEAWFGPGVDASDQRALLRALRRLPGGASRLLLPLGGAAASAHWQLIGWPRTWQLAWSAANLAALATVAWCLSGGPLVPADDLMAGTLDFCLRLPLAALLLAGLGLSLVSWNERVKDPGADLRQARWTFRAPGLFALAGAVTGAVWLVAAHVPEVGAFVGRDLPASLVLPVSAAALGAATVATALWSSLTGAHARIARALAIATFCVTVLVAIISKGWLPAKLVQLLPSVWTGR